MVDSKREQEEAQNLNLKTTTKKREDSGIMLDRELLYMCSFLVLGSISIYLKLCLLGRCGEEESLITMPSMKHREKEKCPIQVLLARILTSSILF